MKGAQLARIGAILSLGACIVWLQANTGFHEPPLDSGLQGRALAERRCTSCHALPDPAQLPSSAWPFVMRWMGIYLGHERPSPLFSQLVEREQRAPSPQIHRDELSRIGRYFIRNALSLEAFSQTREMPPALIEPVQRPLKEAAPPGALVSLLHVDEQRGHVYVANAHDRTLRVLDGGGDLLLEIRLSDYAFDVDPHDNGFLLTTAGDYVLDQHASRIVDYTFEDDEWNGLRRRSLATGLQRTIETHVADLDGDGRQDLVVVSPGFGHGRGFGKVSVLWATAEFEERVGAAGENFDLSRGPLLPGAFEEQTLFDRAGAQVARVTDLDQDGRLDVVVLATRGDNELIAYLGRGNRTFEHRRIEKRHTGWGYSDLAVADVDQDGHLDLIVANGDEPALRVPPPRPYHGVRVLLGDGALGFHEAYHYPLYGATGVFVRDLDRDGDLDIAVSAAYPDWNASRPQTLTLLENQGDVRFAPRALRGPQWGRWRRLSGADLDGDGSVELLLGNSNFPARGTQPPERRRWDARAAEAPGVLAVEPHPMTASAAN